MESTTLSFDMDTTTTLFSMNTTDLVNSSLSATTVAATVATRKAKLLGMIFKVAYTIGIISNAAAIVALRRGERRIRNRKHLLLLTSLAANDLVALMGMLCAMLVKEQVPGVDRTALYCGARVLLRVFGIGSVCIAVTMALERFLALTRPFFYQKQVTYYMIRWALLGSWASAALVTCAPLVGVGLYYDPAKRCCVRYRETTEPLHFAYALVFVLFGTALCVVLVYCNLAVIRALYAITTTPRGSEPLVRRVSRTSCRQRERDRDRDADTDRDRQRTLKLGDAPLHQNEATAEEVAFSRLMALLSIMFMICWMPQMLTAALYLALGPTYWNSFPLLVMSNISNVLMLLNYVLDPVLYVLMWRRGPARACNLRHCLAVCCATSRKSSEESVSMKTSCTPDTLVISVSAPAPAEARPLRPLGHSSCADDC